MIMWKEVEKITVKVEEVLLKLYELIKATRVISKKQQGEKMRIILKH